MNVPTSIKQQVEDVVKRCLSIIESHYGETMRMPSIVYTKKGTTAGTANYATWVIDLNPILLMENLNDFLLRTVPHEVAHLACDVIYPEAHRPIGLSRHATRTFKRDVHGAKWQSIMKVLGVRDITRCHNYDLKSVQKKKVRQLPDWSAKWSTKQDTKIAQCYSLFVSYGLQNDRQWAIDIFVNIVGCTKAGAATYYNMCIKKYVDQSS